MAAFINEMGRMGKIVARRSFLGQPIESPWDIIKMFNPFDYTNQMRDQIGASDGQSLIDNMKKLAQQRASLTETWRALDETLYSYMILNDCSLDEAKAIVDESLGFGFVAKIERMYEEFAALSYSMKTNSSKVDISGLSLDDMWTVTYALYGSEFESMTPTWAGGYQMRVLPAMHGGKMGFAIEITTGVVIVAGLMLFAALSTAFAAGFATGVLVEGYTNLTYWLGLFENRHKERVAELECALSKIQAERDKAKDAVRRARAETQALKEEGKISEDDAQRITEPLDEADEALDRANDALQDAKALKDEMKEAMGFAQRIELALKQIECIVGKVGYYAVLGGAGILAFKVGSAVLDMIRKK